MIDLEGLAHLPLRKRRELAHVVAVLLDMFDDAVRHKGSQGRRMGRILKIILFGSHARGDWVEDPKGRYFSDFDLLVVVNNPIFTEISDYWYQAADRLAYEETITRPEKTPTQFIVHDLTHINDQLAVGRPFFVDIVRDGIVLFEAAEGVTLAKPVTPMPPAMKLLEAQGYFDQWIKNANEHVKFAKFGRTSSSYKMAAFHLHQAAESLYTCAMLVLTLYSPKLHDLRKWRRCTADFDPRLRDIWPRDSKLARQGFDRLWRAYIEARYSPHYEITPEQLDWLIGRAALMMTVVEAICREKLADYAADLSLKIG